MSAHYVGGYMAENVDLNSQLEKALAQLRKDSKKRKFNQTVDLIINLQKFDVKKNAINLVISLPHKIKDKKVCGFFEVKNKNVETITKEEFKKYSNKNELKRLAKRFDFFIAQANLMPAVATTFGKALGPSGKMPSPQLGILINPDDKLIENILTKINSSVKIRTKEASIKVPVGKESMADKEIVDNAIAIYNNTLKNLPRNKENIKNVEIKFTMTKPIKIEIK